MAFIASRFAPVIYFNVPKAGCTSFKNWLYQLEYGQEFPHPLDIHGKAQTLFIHYATNAAEVERRMRSSFVFTFVRHPLRRAYSLYNEKIFRTGPHTFQRVREIARHKYGADFNPSPSLDLQAANFLAYLRFVRDTQTGRIEFRKDPHWMPQSRSVRHALRVRPLDFIGRIETFADDFAFVLKKSGLPEQKAPHYNEAPKPPFSYEDVINDEIRAIGESIYARDLVDFAYQL